MSVEAKRSKPYVRPTTHDDCLVLGRNMREEDKQECSLAAGRSPEESLLRAFALGETFTVMWGTEVVAIFGVIGTPGVVGVPWMLASPLLPKIAKSFLRECRRYTQAMLTVYGRLENYAWAGNTVHIEWLHWLGFVIDPPEPYGLHGQPFHHFYMKD